MPAIGGHEESVEIFAQFGTLICADRLRNDCFAMSRPRAKINYPPSMNSNDPVFLSIDTSGDAVCGHPYQSILTERISSVTRQAWDDK